MIQLRLLKILVLFWAASLTVLGCSTAPTKRDHNLKGYYETGKASYYANKFQNRKTASGERYSHYAKTAAHKNHNQQTC